MLLTGYQLRQNEGLYAQYFAIRTKIFHQALKWDVRIDDEGVERDQFDRDDTVYLLSLKKGMIQGMWRAVRSDRPYMLDTIPSLRALYTKAPPKSADTWELSRFYSAHKNNDERYHIVCELVCTLAEFGMTHGIKRVTMVQAEDLSPMIHGVYHTYPSYMGPGLIVDEFDHRKNHVVEYEPMWSLVAERLRDLFKFPAPLINQYKLECDPSFAHWAAE